MYDSPAMAANLIEFAQDLKQRVPIDDVIRDYVPGLKRMGRTWKGLCPFHEEKTPSFNVNPEFGFYHCFGCGASGDAIKFVQEFEKIDFKLAVERVARKAGLSVPEFHGSGTPEQRSEAQKTREALLAVCKNAEQFFFDQLERSPQAEAAREYLIRRGLTPDQIRQYRLGWAPDAAADFLREAKVRGYSAERVAEAGLAIAKDDGRFIDRFRGRIIFPIADTRGEIVAFGGRLIEGDGPKYLNSSDTPLFHKGRLLYGLIHSRDAIRDEQRAVLLEGYMDWIALHSNGIRNALAGLGTAFTPDQARLLRRMTQEAILFYDGDEAGRKAAYRTSELLLAEGLTVRVAALPPEHDPDSLIRAEGTAAVRAVIDKARHAIDYFIDNAMDLHPVGTPEGKARIVDHLAPLLAAVADPVLQTGWIQQAGARIGLDERTMRAGLRKRSRVVNAAARGGPQEEDQVFAPQDCGTPAERQLLQLLAGRLDRFEMFELVTEELFTSPAMRRVFLAMHDAATAILEGGDAPESLLTVAGDDERRLIAMILNEEGPAPNIRPGFKFKEIPQEELFDSLRTELERRRLREIRRLEARNLGPGGHPLHGDTLERIHRMTDELRGVHRRLYEGGPDE